MKKILLTAALISLLATSATAQQVIGFILNGGVGTPVAVSSANPLPITGSISVGSAAFTPTSATSNATINVTNASSATALPTGVTQVITNSGSKTAYLTLSIGAGTAATTGYPILAGSTITFTPGTATYLNAITGGTDTTTLLVSGGSGTFQGAGGGGSSSGGGLQYTQGSTTSGQSGTVSMCAVISSAPTATTADSYFPRCDTHQSLFVINADSTGTPLDPLAPINCGTTDTFVQCLAQGAANVVTLGAGTAQIGVMVPATHAQTSALASSVSVAAPHTINSFEVTADSTLSAAAWYVIVFDATSLPANGSITPAKCYGVPSGQTTFGASFGEGGLALTTGLTVGVSTTGCFTQTASAHAFLGIDYK